MNQDRQAEIIADYIKDPRYTQAVMINGEWGSGKTFFVENTLMSYLEEYIVVRYSLYGVQSSEQVINDIKNEMLKKVIEKSSFKKNNFTIPSKLIEITPNLFDVIWKRLGFETKNIVTLINQIDYDKSKMIIIFDDLERTGMEIAEVLGVINSFVECQKLKVVIIANENEIGTSRISSNLPQKFSVALNSSLSLNSDNTSPMNRQDGDNTQNNRVYNYKELIERTRLLFSNDIIYNSIKEKLIGLTVTINADYARLYNELVTQYAKCSKDYLLQNEEIVIEILSGLQCQNLRTFIFAIISFDKIYEVINKLNSPEKSSLYLRVLGDELTNILKSILTISFLCKSGKLSSPTNIEDSSLWYLLRGVKKYQFVNDYIYYHELNMEEIINEVEGYIQTELRRHEKEDEKNSLSFYKLDSFAWVDYSDSEVILLSDQLYDELLNEKYDVSFFKYIVIFLLQLEYHFKDKKKFLKHVDNQYISLMEQFIRNHSLQEGPLELLKAFSDDKEFIEKYNLLILPLLTATKEKLSATGDDQIADLFKSENWANDFYTFCRNNHDSFLTSHCFLSSINMDLVRLSLKQASNGDIRRFSQAICLVYDFSNIRDYYQNDIPYLDNIIKILCEINENDTTDCTTRIVTKSAIDNLKNKLLLLTNQ